MGHILLIEPNRLLSKQYQEFLESQGHDVTVVQNAQAAVNAADQARPDAVVMELLLAGHGGIEFLYEFRSYTEWRQVPALLLTRLARADVAVNDQTLADLGVADYLYKPETSLKRLSQRLDAVLNQVARSK